MRILALCVLLTIALPAAAQLRVPGVSLGLPPLPPATRALEQVEAAPLATLEHARRDVAARLLREHPRELDSDPNGELVVRGQILALSPSEAALGSLTARGYVVARDETLESIDVRVVSLLVPPDLTTREALRLARQTDPQGTYEFDHVYGSGGTTTASTATTAAPATQAPAGAPARAGAPVRVGVLDTGLETSHPALASTALHTWGCDGTPVAAAHGTAVASLLVEHGATEIYAADVYCDRPTGAAADAIVRALAWFAAQRVGVVNLSLVGPANVVLQHGVAALVARGHLIVAAVGNDGPASPPLYPAAYPGVVGVTGVDARRRVLIEAVRGPQVMFAAPGADITAAGLNGSRGPVRGTSFAAPALAPRLAAGLAEPDPTAAAAALRDLQDHAIDLGKPGRDTTYGFGLVLDPKK